MKEVLEELISSYYSPKEYPCLHKLGSLWSKTKPLQGKKILIATPIFRNTMTQYVALIAAGAELVLGYGKGLSYDPKQMEKLKKIGFSVVNSQEEPIPFDIILDCAGIFSACPARLGYVELTRSGVDYYRKSEKPAFMADSGEIKKIETVLGTGESYFRALEKLGYTPEKGERLLVFGSGKVGRGVIMQAYRRGMEIEVVSLEQSLDKVLGDMIARLISLDEKEKIEKAVLRADYLVMATGVKAAFLAGCCAETLNKSGAVCANMGVEDEFGESVPENRVLEQKRSLNFILEEPTHLKYIEATLALHAYGAIYLCEHPQAKGILLPPKEIEEEMIEITKKEGLISDELKTSSLYVAT